MPQDHANQIRFSLQSPHMTSHGFFGWAYTFRTRSSYDDSIDKDIKTKLGLNLVLMIANLHMQNWRNVHHEHVSELSAAQKKKKNMSLVDGHNQLANSWDIDRYRLHTTWSYWARKFKISFNAALLYIYDIEVLQKKRSFWDANHEADDGLSR